MNTQSMIAIGVATALSLAALSACGGEEPRLVGYQVDPAPQVGEHTVTDGANDDEPFALRAQSGGLLITFVGFTNCPEACPTAFSEVRVALDRLGDDAAPVDVAMITVDPTRDTSEVLTTYVQQFVKDAHALRAEDPEQLQRIVNDFGATYDTAHDHDGNTTDVGHTDYTYLIDDTGTVALTWTADMTVDDLVNDLRIMLDRRS